MLPFMQEELDILLTSDSLYRGKSIYELFSILPVSINQFGNYASKFKKEDKSVSELPMQIMDENHPLSKLFGKMVTESQPYFDKFFFSLSQILLHNEAIF